MLFNLSIGWLKQSRHANRVLLRLRRLSNHLAAPTDNDLLHMALGVEMFSSLSSNDTD
jgi:hypothetical protein